MAKYKICPYCYKEYTLTSLKLHCKKCENDFSVKKIYIPYQFSMKMGVLPKINKCPSCGKVKRSNITFKCNQCDQELSRNIIELKNKIISIVGGRGSGKTIFISLLIDELKKNIKVGEGRTLKIANDDNREIDIISDIQDRIKIHKTLPDATEPRELESDDSTAGVPLTYFYRGERGAIALSFYDSSGEDLQNFEAFQKEYDYIRNTSGIIFMMDIFSGTENLRNTEYSLINLVKLLKIELGLNMYAEIPIPVSFVLNKFDLYAPTEVRHVQWNGSNDDIILNTIDTVHSSLLKHFENTSEDNLGNVLQICEESFSNYRFIPVSSLGFNPDGTSESKLENKLKPFDIEYPYVYLLNIIN